MPKGNWVDFEEVEKLATIEQLADMLGLKYSRSKTQIRAPCPIHEGDERTLAISPNVNSRRGSAGVFFCQASKQGGDRIALVAHCMEIGQQDAALFIKEQFGHAEDTVESTGTSHSTVSKTRATFDPVAFAAKLEYTDEVKVLGYSEEEARAFRVGFYRGHVYVPNVYASGVIAGWSKLIEGKLTKPATWLPDTSNVVQFKTG